MTRKSELEAAKERRRAYRRAYHAKRYATDPEYRALMQAHARKRHAEIRANPKRHAAHKKKPRKVYHMPPLGDERA